MHGKDGKRVRISLLKFDLLCYPRTPFAIPATVITFRGKQKRSPMSVDRYLENIFRKRRVLLFSDGSNKLSDHFLTVTIKHESIGSSKEWVGDAGKSRAQTPFNDHHGLRLINIADRHAIDGTGCVLTR